MFKKTILEPGVSGEVSLINADIILKSFDKMGCHAFSPGERDFAAGKNFILEASKNTDFPFISCNIYDLNNQLLFEPYIIYESKGTKIVTSCFGREITLKTIFVMIPKVPSLPTIS